MTNLICRILSCLRYRWHHHVYMKYQRRLLGACGENVTIMPNCNFFPHNRIYIGSNVYIGANASFLSTEANIRIGNYVLFGPHVSIVTGNHRTDVIGEYMFNVKEKMPENDADVIIEDDVWVGMNAMILKGVIVGRGSIIAGGTIVNKSVPPYSVCLNNRIMARFTSDEIIRHEKLLMKKYGYI